MVQHVKFKNNNLKIAANLYLPENINKNEKHPAIVVVHPGGGVKEQTAGLYAQKLSEHGFITLAFDASYQGESEGEPRFQEDPTARVEDIRAAVDYLNTLPFVHEEQIGAMGICAGGGYAINAVQTERRIKAVAGVSALDIGSAYRKGWTGNVPVSTQVKTLEAVGNQRLAEAKGAASMCIPYVPTVLDETTEPDLAEAHEYYLTSRAQHPNSKNQMLFTSLDRIMAFTAFDQIDTLLTQPLLLIAGSKAGSLWHSESVYKGAIGEKELFIVDGATHVALYDVPKYVEQAVTKLKEFFSKHL